MFGTLLATGIQRPAFAHAHEHLQRQCGLAYARFTAQQHQTAGDQSAAQDAVEFRRLHVDTHLLGSRNILNTLRLRRATGRDTPLVAHCGCHRGFLVGAPLAAYRATPQHLRGFRATVGTYIFGCHFHGVGETLITTLCGGNKTLITTN